MVGVHFETKLEDPAAHLNIQTRYRLPEVSKTGSGELRVHYQGATSPNSSSSVYFSFAQSLLLGILHHTSRPLARKLYVCLVCRIWNLRMLSNDHSCPN